MPIAPSGQDYFGVVIVDGRTVSMPFHSALQVGLVDVPLIVGNMQVHFLMMLLP